MRAAVEHLRAFYPHLKRVTEAIEYGKTLFHHKTVLFQDHKNQSVFCFIGYTM